ncbi:hypothetical protein Tco_0483814 [Tanacetum coccineum]
MMTTHGQCHYLSGVPWRNHITGIVTGPPRNTGQRRSTVTFNGGRLRSTVAVNDGYRLSTVAVNDGQRWQTTVDHRRTTGQRWLTATVDRGDQSFHRTVDPESTT